MMINNRKLVFNLLLAFGLLLFFPIIANAQTWFYLEDFVGPNGEADKGGWTAKDFVDDAIPGPFFETQTYESRTVLWCGREDPTYTGGQGYGNQWEMWVEKEFLQASGSGNPGRIAFDIQYDVEDGYDYVSVMVSYDNRASWGSMASFTGTSNGFEHVELNWEAWTVGPPIWIRFQFQSDGASSNEPGPYSQAFDGAFRLDNVQLIDIRDNSVRDESNFDTGLDDWIPGKPHGPGNYYDLWHEDHWSGVAEPHPEGFNYAWTAFDPATGFFPPQDFGDDHYLMGIESPVIQLPADGHPYFLRFDVFRQLPMLENLFYTWQVAAPPPEEGGSWQNRNFIYYGTYGQWQRQQELISDLMAPEATSIKVRLIARYYHYYPYATGVFTGPGPIFGALAIGATVENPVGALAGRVFEAEDAGCASPGEGLYGVTLNLFDSLGGAVELFVTNEGGNFAATDLPAGEYMLSLVRPLGYGATSDDVAVTIVGDQTTQVDFALTCNASTGSVRTIGYWKHQVNKAAGGTGLGGGRAIKIDDPIPADIESPVCDLLDVVATHFNDNAVNQVLIYEPPGSALCADKLDVALTLLNLGGDQEMVVRAQQQLMALLLNAAAGFIHLTEVVSDDGATLSQAITYCDNIIDDPEGDHELAKTIADEINNGRMVNEGMIPLDTVQIAYRQGQDLPSQTATLEQNRPNPFNPTTQIIFRLVEPGPAQLKVFSMDGRLVCTLVDQFLGDGRHEVTWRGTDNNGQRVSSGTYYYSLKTESGIVTHSMTLLK